MQKSLIRTMLEVKFMPMRVFECQCAWEREQAQRYKESHKARPKNQHNPLSSGIFTDIRSECMSHRTKASVGLDETKARFLMCPPILLEDTVEKHHQATKHLLFGGGSSLCARSLSRSVSDSNTWVCSQLASTRC